MPSEAQNGGRTYGGRTYGGRTSSLKRWAPTLVVSGSPRGIKAETLHALAGECGELVAVDSGLAWLDAAAIVPDAIVGDFDSVDPALLENYRPSGTQRRPFEKGDGNGIVFERHRPEKDETDLELALEFARRNGTRGCVVACIVANVLGGRIDHELAALGALAAFEGAVAAFDDEQAMLFMRAEGPCARVALADLGLAPGDEYSVIAFGEPAVVSQSGAVYSQDSVEIAPFSGLGVSNVVAAPDACVQVERGMCALVVCAESSRRPS